jgi:hypothetical protein
LQRRRFGPSKDTLPIYWSCIDLLLENYSQLWTMKDTMLMKKQFIYNCEEPAIYRASRGNVYSDRTKLHQER